MFKTITITKKKHLIVFDLISQITGIILIAVGAGVASTFNEYDSFMQSRFYSITTFLIVIGVFIFIIAFFGCCGAIRENYWMVLIFSVLLGIIFVLELAAGISGYVLRNEAEHLLENQLISTQESYETNSEIAKLWDFTQAQFTCCGTKNFSDWTIDKNVTFGTETVGALPMSCCSMPTGLIGTFKCGKFPADVNLYPDGCLTEFSNYIADHAVSLGAAGIIIAIIQFFGVLFACYIAREIKIRDGIAGFM